MNSFGILGAGTWGTALANMLANMGHTVCVWSPEEKEIDDLIKRRVHRHLPNCVLNMDIEFTHDISFCINNKDYIILATPSIYIRSTVRKIKDIVDENQIIITVAKGIEKDTMFTMSEIIKDELGNNFKVVSLSGPTHAEEVALGMPTLIVSACEDINIATQVRDAINNDVLRVYSNADIKGVEIAGALKNIIALACGMSEGMGFGDNAKAAIITRGLHEITKLGVKMGCKVETFFGLTGIGDIVVTSISNFSRNHNAGVLLAKGYSLEETLEKIGMVVEGINALNAAKELEEKYEVDMPIVNAVYDVVYHKENCLEAVRKLFKRQTKDE